LQILLKAEYQACLKDKYQEKSCQSLALAQDKDLQHRLKKNHSAVQILQAALNDLGLLKQKALIIELQAK
jgi:hypothetical protein